MNRHSIGFGEEIRILVYQIFMYLGLCEIGLEVEAGWMEEGFITKKKEKIKGNRD